MAATVRIDPEAYAGLRAIADQLQLPLQEALARAIEAYRRQIFFEGLAADFVAIEADPAAAAEEADERAAWDQTNGDGLANE